MPGIVVFRHFPGPSVSLGSRLRVPETGLIFTIPS